MTAFTDKLRQTGGLVGSAGSTTSPPKNALYKDVNGEVRVANSGVKFIGYPEAFSGATIITENDKGKTNA